MGKKRQYSDQQKAEALALLAANGGNITRTSELLGIPYPTIADWNNGKGIHPAVLEIREEKKQSLSQEIKECLSVMIGVAREKARDADFKDLWIGVGIGVDKAQLLDGEPTAITQNGTLTDEQRIARITALLDAGRARRTAATGGQLGAGPVGPPAGPANGRLPQ